MTFATLNGYSIARGCVRWPARGAWVADLTLDRAVEFAGVVTLVVGNLALAGTVLRGSTYAGASAWRVVAGAGRWGADVSARAYRNDAGVKRSLVLSDLARDAGEVLVPAATDLQLGTAWTRRAGPARAALAEAWGAEWYVSEAGPTVRGARPATAVTAARQVTHEEPDHGLLELATEDPAGIRPGMLLDGRLVRSVTYRIGDAFRAQVWV